MDVFSSVEELTPQENVRVIHRRLRVPKDEYYQQVTKYDGPGFEEKAQQFIRDYLDNIGDKGWVGMVRSGEEGDWVLIDATLRYPLDTGE